MKVQGIIENQGKNGRTAKMINVESRELEKENANTKTVIEITQT